MDHTGHSNHATPPNGAGKDENGPTAPHHSHHEMMVQDFRRRFWFSLVLSVPVLLLSPMIQEWTGLTMLRFTGQEWVLLLLSTAVYLYGGWPFLTGLIEELSERKPGMMTLVAMAITVAFVYSAAVVFGLRGDAFFWETVTLIDLMLLGHWIEMRSVLGASRALEELVKLLPSGAHLVQEDGSTIDVPVSDLRAGQRVSVRPGEKVPADALVVDGSSSVNESLLTGESRPVKKEAGSEVIAGSINGNGVLVVEVQRTGEESYLSQVVTLVREAQASRSHTQDLADRAAFLLTIVALSVGAVTFITWLMLDRALPFAIGRAVTVMVIACPHALGLAIPLVVAVSTSLSAGKGLLIRNRSAFERARNLDTVVFDKTGTLTRGTFGVTKILRYGDTPEDEILRLAAAVEANSEHPIAAGVMNGAADRNIRPPRSTGFQALTGKGVQASVEGRRVSVLSPEGIRELGLEPGDERVLELSRAGQTLVYVVEDKTLIGTLALADVIRDESRDAITSLHTMGIDVMMLTGDHNDVAQWVARELGLDRVFAEVLPHEKSERIRELQQEGRSVAMTGDGVNDAPALATADVGIAIGAGTDVAVETADIVLVRSDPRDVVSILKLSRASYRKMVQNLWYAAGYNIVAIPLAAGVLAWAGLVLSPTAGAVLMSLSTVVVAINARLLRPA